MRTGNFLFLFFLFFLVFNLSSFENSDDSSELLRKIKEYDDNKVSIALKPFVLNMDEDERKTFYQDKVPFDVYRGNGKKTKLSFLAEEMGNRTLAQKLRLGENHHIFVPCFAVSVAVSALFHISRSAALSASFSTTQDASGNEI
nr:hypothetical protein [Spirochaetota bacterium]